MARATNMVLRLLPVMVIPAMMAMSGCIKEDNTEDCPPVSNIVEEKMIVTVMDAATNKYMTVSDEIVDGSLFFFNNNVKTIGYNAVPKSELGIMKSIPALPDAKDLKTGDTIFISAWGNIEGNINVIGYYEPGQDILTPFLHIEPNQEYPGYYMCPGVLFFGMRRIVLGGLDHEIFDWIETTETGDKRLVHEIQITQLNSLLTIQVEGLPEGFDPDDYYFEIGRQNSGYDYQGLPFTDEGGLHVIREVGVLNSREFLVTAQPYNLIPSINADDPSDMTSATAVAIRLFQKAGTRAAEGDIDLTGDVTTVDYPSFR